MLNSKKKTTKDKKSLTTNKVDPKRIISDYAANKVIDWIIENKVDRGYASTYCWSEEDKTLLKEAVLEPLTASRDLPFQNIKLRQFFQSVIENGLNTDDVRMFQKYKNKLPLHALGLIYDISDFKKGNRELVSRKKIDAGFYMYEIIAKPKIYIGQLEISLKLTNENDESDRVATLTAQPDKIAKRLIRLDYPSTVTIMSNANWSTTNIQHFRLARLTKNFFVSRICKKLGKEYSEHQLIKLTNTEIDQLCYQYEKLFTRSISKNENGYHQKISAIELPLIFRFPSG
jgi:hypothetical protein